MISDTKKKIFTGSASGIIAKVIDAFAKLFTIPLLIGYYGRLDFGLITLAVSLNAYLRIMDLGMNTGAIRFYSIWFLNEETNKVTQASQSSILFYGIIGVLNAIILVVLAFWSEYIFSIEPSQLKVFKMMLYMLAVSSLVFWLSYNINQLLIAYGEIAWTNYSLTFGSVLHFISAFLAVYLELSITTYFLLYVLSTVLIIPINLWRIRILPLQKQFLFLPKWNPIVFKEILKYSVGIFAIGLFNYSADSLRPILLGVFSIEGPSVLTDYKIMSTIIMLVSAIGAVFLQVLLPIASRSYAKKDTQQMQKLIYEGTKYLSIFFSFIIFILIVNIEALLEIYVGKGYVRLSLWLSLWLVLMLYMHDFAISSIILSTGKTKVLIYSSGIAAITSLLTTYFLIPTYEVGATVIGFGVFVFIQMGFNYCYYLPVILKVKSFKVFSKSFLPPTFIGVLIALLVAVFKNYVMIDNLIFNIMINSLLFSVLFGVCVACFIIKPQQIKFFYKLILDKT